MNINTFIGTEKAKEEFAKAVINHSAFVNLSDSLVDEFGDKEILDDEKTIMMKGILAVGITMGYKMDRNKTLLKGALLGGLAVYSINKAIKIKDKFKKEVVEEEVGE